MVRIILPIVAGSKCRMNQFNPADARHWVPAPQDGDAPLYRRIADALQAAVQGGELAAGARLPTQRALADALRISTGTATAAYLEAERRGLVRRHVGRGTFVASPGTRVARPAGHANLAVNIPPFHGAAGLIRKLLGQLIEDADAEELLGYPRFRADGRFATAVASWMSRRLPIGPVQAVDVLPCQGATQGLVAVLDHLFADGDALACEQVTYGGFKVVARALGLRLVPTEQDGEGMTPDALERAAREHGAKAALLCPTHQNPTGVVASLERRQALLAVARRHRLWIVEDDVYGALAAPGSAVPPFRALDPARTFHVSSASKAIAPGFRAGWVVAPRDHRDAVAAVLQARISAMAPFGCPVLTAGAAPFGFLAFTKMCETRMADDVLGMIRDEACRRAALARRILGPHLHPSDASSLHVWLPMRSGADQLYQQLVERQIHATPPDAPMVGAPPSGLRLCLGGMERTEELEGVLHIIRDELATRAPITWGP